MISCKVSDRETALQENSPATTSTQLTDKELQELTNVVNASSIQEFKVNPQAHSWQELDSFFRALPQKYQNTQHLQAIQKHTVATMLDHYNLGSKVDEKNVSLFKFYAKELNRLQTGYPSLYAKVVKNMRNFDNKEAEALKRSYITQFNTQKIALKAKLQQHQATMSKPETAEKTKKWLRIGIQMIENTLQTEDVLLNS